MKNILMSMFLVVAATTIFIWFNSVDDAPSDEIVQPKSPPHASTAFSETIPDGQSKSPNIGEVSFVAEPLSIGDSDQSMSGKLEVYRSEIQRIIGSESKPRWCKYDAVRGALGPEHVPLLRGLLSDDSYKNRWAQISQMAIWLCDPNDRATVTAILDYVKRPDLWDESNSKHPGVHLMAKAKALSYLGIMDSDLVSRILRDAFTESGSEELIASWIDLPHPGEYGQRRFLRDVFRGEAAMGLVLLQEQEKIQIIRDDFEAFVHKTQREVHVQGEFTEETRLDIRMYDHLADALAANDIIEDIGREAFLRVWDTEQGFQLAFDYLGVYAGRTLEDGRYVFDLCPICGAKREKVSLR